ncbi:histidine-rich glycoprotein isoform X2 [Drosophila innubila]|uniref:histidine-rich glycoprotein isoform X2 n=1 Tax=Drosophila innubila TaxID=198719 RepID=UPI00148E2E73|nr:histidine-rich glycoprotein isoform X2 [Drosophila innubila]
MLVCVQETNAGQQKKKKIVIHVPVHKKIEKHVHTVIKHVHHHHKPIVLKEEKKIIHEEHRPIQIHQTKEQIHHHENYHEKHDHHNHHDHHEHHEHHHPIEQVPVEQEEEHIHHHHNYEHKDSFVDASSDASSSEEH